MQHKTAETSAPLHDIIQNRWSPRSFDAGKPLSAETLTALLEAGRWAPSCFNDQPWRFIVCDKTANPAAWGKLLGTLSEKNRLWAQNAPLLLLSVAMRDFGHNGQTNRWAAYDTGAACLNICLQATAMGLASHQMGGFDADQCRALFNLPVACTPLSVLAIGYQAEADKLTEELRQKEVTPRSRKPLTDCFFFADWQYR